MATKLNHSSKANVLSQRTWHNFKLNAFIILASPPTLQGKNILNNLNKSQGMTFTV